MLDSAWSRDFWSRARFLPDLIFMMPRAESHIDFRTQCVIMTLVGWGAITNDVLKFIKVIEFESSCIIICFSYIYLIIDGKRSFINQESS